MKDSATILAMRVPVHLSPTAMILMACSGHKSHMGTIGQLHLRKELRQFIMPVFMSCEYSNLQAHMMPTVWLASSLCPTSSSSS